MITKKVYLSAALLVIIGLSLIVFSIAVSKKQTADNKIQYGGTYIYAVGHKLETLNPRNIVWLVSKNALSLIYDPLIGISRDLVLTPRVCESWEMLSDSSLFVCKIRKGIFFHDGTPLTSDDVIFSLNYLLKDGGLDVSDFKLISGIDEYWSKKSNHISGIKKNGDYEVFIQLTTASPNFISIIATPRMVILPKDLFGREEKEFFTHPVGSGPFVFEKQGDSELVVIANNKYFEGRPYLDRIEFKVLPYDEAIKAFKAGSVNDISSYKFSINELFKDVKHAKIYPTESYSTTVLFVNTSRQPFNDITYRKSLFALVDRKQIVDECYQGSKIAYSIIPLGILGHYSSSSDNSNNSIDLNSAITVLNKQSSFDKVIYYGSNEIDKCAIDVINKIFTKNNLSWHLVPASSDELASMFFSGKLLAHIETLTTKNEEAYTILKYFDSSSNENLSRINDQFIDATLYKSLTTNDSTIKSELYKQIDDTIIGKGYAFPLLYPPNFILIDNRFHGNEYRIMSQYIDFTKIWKEND